MLSLNYFLINNISILKLWNIMNCHWYLINHCRSCELLNQTYEETLRHKEQKLLELFPNQKSLLSSTVGIEGSVNGTRNKAKLAVNQSDLGEMRFGFYDNSLNFKELESCPLHMEGLNDILPMIKRKLLEFNIFPYNVSEKKGELKYIILSKSESHQQFLVRFVLRSKESLDRLKKMSKILQEEFPEIMVVTANIQFEHKAILEGDEEIVLSTNNYITHQFDDVFLTLGARSFFQVTPKIAAKLYIQVGELVQVNNINSFLDLYCGVGAFSFFAARYCPKVLGVEISEEAIACAQSSISKNQIKGEINFQSLDVEDFLNKLTEQYDAILVNPPRRGLSVSIIENILKKKPRFIFYSSCNAVSLKRDLELFEEDYSVTYSQIFDMFPYTEHFETLMVLKRK
jgi:23S rRNA (uracil747-C5)-methyltransferase